MSIESQWKKFLGSKPLPNPARSTILVVNPAPSRGATRAAKPKSAKRESATTSKERKPMATAKQIAARKRFAAMARSGAFKKSRKKHKKARNPSTTVSRPRVHVTATGKGKRKSYKFSLGKKSPYKGRTTSVNPGRRRRARKHYRRNPSRAGKKFLGFLDLKSVISFGLGAAGFIGGVKGLQYVAKIPGFGPKADGTPGTLAPYRGGVYLLVALFALAKVKNTMVRDAAVGIGIAGVYDLVAVNVKAANIATLAGADYSLVGYDPMLGEDVGPGDLNNLNGRGFTDFAGADTTLLGVDASTIY